MFFKLSIFKISKESSKLYLLNFLYINPPVIKNKPPMITMIVLNIKELKYTSGNSRAKSLFRILAIILMPSKEAIDIIISPKPIKIKHNISFLFIKQMSSYLYNQFEYFLIMPIYHIQQYIYKTPAFHALLPNYPMLRLVTISSAVSLYNLFASI